MSWTWAQDMVLARVATEKLLGYALQVGNHYIITYLQLGYTPDYPQLPTGKHTKSYC